MMVDNYIIGGISQSGQVIFEVMIAVKSIYSITNAILQYTPITARVSTTHGMDLQGSKRRHFTDLPIRTARQAKADIQGILWSVYSLQSRWHWSVHIL